MTSRNIAEKILETLSKKINLSDINKEELLIEIEKDITTYRQAYSGLKSADEFYPQLSKNEYLYQLTGMKYRLSKTQISKLIDMFIVEQQAVAKQYHSYSDCVKHCMYWIGSNSAKAPQENVKSSGKLLGL